MSVCACNPLNDYTCLVHDDNDFAERIEAIEADIAKILAITERVEAMAQKVADQIKPVLDDLMKSPLLKMLGVKSK